jgi:hypothetical protein
MSVITTLDYYSKIIELYDEHIGFLVADELGYIYFVNHDFNHRGPNEMIVTKYNLLTNHKELYRISIITNITSVLLIFNDIIISININYEILRIIGKYIILVNDRDLTELIYDIETGHKINEIPKLYSVRPLTKINNYISNLKHNKPDILIKFQQ